MSGDKSGRWVETGLGRRYMEDSGSCIAFFRTGPDPDGKRRLPREAAEAIIKAKAGR